MAKHVAVEYTGTLEDGSQFDSNVGKEPLEFILGSGMMIPGFEKAVQDMSVGESKTVRLSPEEAYGEYQEALIQEAPVDQIPNSNELPVGETVYFQSPDGRPIPAKVLSVNDKIARFDFNHELAGKTLIFDIKLISSHDDDEK